MHAGWRKVLQEREELFPLAKARLEAFAACHGTVNVLINDPTSSVVNHWVMQINPCVHVAGERVLQTPGNPISIAMTLRSLNASEGPIQSGAEAASQQPGTGSAGPVDCTSAAEQPLDVTYFNDTYAMTYKRHVICGGCRGVSGARVVSKGRRQAVAGHHFASYGAHNDRHRHCLLTDVTRCSLNTKHS